MSYEVGSGGPVTDEEWEARAKQQQEQRRKELAVRLIERAHEEPARVRQVGGDHYRDKTVQPWDALEAWMTPEQFKGYLRGSVIKYVSRCDDKGGVMDLRKARHTLDRLIELEESRAAAVPRP